MHYRATHQLYFCSAHFNLDNCTAISKHQTRLETAVSFSSDRCELHFSCLLYVESMCVCVCMCVQSATGVTCTMACMSRAGREPGFKKQNQDNCFAFEKYITNEQSLFGAFDGHGPNGMPSSCSRLNSWATSHAIPRNRASNLYKTKEAPACTALPIPQMRIRL